MKKIGRIVIVLGILFILLFLTTGFSFNSPEAVAMNRNTVKYYTTIQVHAGDSSGASQMNTSHRNIQIWTAIYRRSVQSTAYGEIRSIRAVI